MQEPHFECADVKRDLAFYRSRAEVLTRITGHPHLVVRFPLSDSLGVMPEMFYRTEAAPVGFEVVNE